VKVQNEGLRKLHTSINIKPVRLSEIKAERMVALAVRITQSMYEILTSASQKRCGENTTCKS
jgi:hypothetical protein